MSVVPTQGGWTWGLELTSFGYGTSQETVTGLAEMVRDGNRVTYEWSDTLDEWYVNRPGGLEHGYTLHKRPGTGSDGELLVFEIDVCGELIPSVMGDRDGVRFLDAEGICAMTYAGLVVFDANGMELEAGFERSGNDLQLKIDDGDAVYPITIDPVVQLAYIKAQIPDSVDGFGESIAISGNTAVIGAPYEDSDSVGVGGPQDNNNRSGSGAVYVFVRNGNSWSFQQYIKSTNPGSNDFFGLAVAIDGDTMVVGAPYEDSDAVNVGGDGSNDALNNAGAAYVYVRTGGTWSAEAFLKASNTGANDNFAWSVDVDGDLVIVGAPREDSAAVGIGGDGTSNGLPSSGAAYAFERSGSTWSPLLYMKASNTDGSDLFGQSVGVSGSRIAVGARAEDSSATGVNGDQASNGMPTSGAVYVFESVGGVWSQDAYIKASNPGSQDYFGENLAIDGNTLVVGAHFEDSGALGVDGDGTDNSVSNSGAAYVFANYGMGWAQEAYLKASNANTLAAGVFGTSVAVSGDRIAVGAVGESSAATGIGGDQSNGTMTAAGAAYVFTRLGGVWSQAHYVKASNTDAGDTFGDSAALSGDTLLVGATGEDGSSGGINGDQSTGSKSGSGAVYAYDLDSTCGVTQYGPGTGANIADLNVFGAPLPNQAIAFETSGWTAGGSAILLLSFGPTNAPLLGGTLLVNPGLSLLGPGVFLSIPVAVNSGSLNVVIPPVAAGLTIYAQAGMIDGTQVAGFALTNGLQVSVCP